MHAHLRQALDVLHGAKVLGVHDVGAVFVFEGRHQLVRAIGFLQQEHLPGWRAEAQGRFRLMVLDDFAELVFGGRLRRVFPAAGVGATALIRVALVHVARQQAATGIGHAQRAMDEHLQLHGRHVLADFADFVQRQFPRQDDPAQALLLPELHARPVHRVGLHREVDWHLRIVSAHQHDQAGVGHDQRVGRHGDDGRQVLEEGLELGIVRRDVDYHIETLALSLCLANAEGQVGMIEFVVAHPQAVARLAGVHRIGAIGEGVTHVFQGAGGGEQFGSNEVHGGSIAKAAEGKRLAPRLY
ncbi:hypothetical protein D3C71_1374890 [compost metagenome]